MSMYIQQREHIIKTASVWSYLGGKLSNVASMILPKKKPSFVEKYVNANIPEIAGAGLGIGAGIYTGNMAYKSKFPPYSPEK